MKTIKINFNNRKYVLYYYNHRLYNSLLFILLVILLLGIINEIIKIYL